MATNRITAKAIVSRGSHREGKWAIEPVTLRDLAPNELLIQMVASGICHTDMHFGDAAESIGGYPRVMGHEGELYLGGYGSGYVKAVGASVKVAQCGDPVLLSFNHCGTCEACKDGHPSKCREFSPCNFGSSKLFCSKDSHDGTVDTIGGFFGQSSFASYSIAAENSVVNAKNLVGSADELKLLAPLGCGIQTGCGTVTNYANAQASDSIAILGLGGVGLGAIMGAKLAGCKTIIGIDKVASRLDLAKDLGATHIINTNDMTDLAKLVSEVQKATEGQGTSITVDTTGVIPVMESGIEFTGPRGRYIQVGTAPGDKNVSLNMLKLMILHKTISSAIEGDVVPKDYVPKMVGWWREGNLPIEKFTKFFKAEDFQKAIQEMHDGSTVKPIILW